MRSLWFLSLLLPITATAGDITLGGEINLSRDDLERALIQSGQGRVPTKQDARAVKEFANHLRSICGRDCTVVERPNGKWGNTEYKVTFHGKWGFNISTDPAVVEIQPWYGSTRNIRKNTKWMQKYVFDAAAEIGLTPESRLFNEEHQIMHVNIGARSAFGDSPKSLIHFAADYSNRPALALGGLGRDPTNAPPLLHLDDEQIHAFGALVDRANRREPMSLEEIGHYFKDYVYTKSPHTDPVADAGEHLHNQALSVRKLTETQFDWKDVPFEIRPIRHPKSAEEYALVMELFEKRVQYIKSLKNEPIYFRHLNEALLRAKSIHPERSAVAMGVEMEIFFREMGVDWHSYKSLLDPAVAMAMESGHPADLLEGRVEWTLESDRRLFQECVLEKFYYSPWTRKQVAGLFHDKQLPEEFMVKALELLHADAAKDPRHLRHLQEFVQKHRLPQLEKHSWLAALFKRLPDCEFPEWMRSTLVSDPSMP